MPISHVRFTSPPRAKLMPPSAEWGEKKGLFHYRELSCSWNNSDWIRALNHFKASSFITGNSAHSWPIWRLTFSIRSFPRETVDCSHYLSTDKCVATPPCLSHLPLFSVAIRRRRRSWKVREDAERSSTEQLPVSEGFAKETSITPNAFRCKEEHRASARPHVFHQALVSLRPPRAMPSSAGMKDPSALCELNRPSR